MILELQLEGVSQPQHDLAVGAAVAGRHGHGHLGERPLPPPAAHEAGVGLHLDSQPLAREVGQGVGAPRRIEHEAREHRVVDDAGQLHAVPPQHEPVVIDVVTGLANLRVHEQRS